MNPFESTIDNPLRFLKAFFRFDGYSFLEKQFVNSDDPDFKYDNKLKVIIAQGILPREDQRGELLDEETNTREYEITFPEYVSNEFVKQFDITKKLIGNQSRHNSDGQDRKLYRMILIDCLELQKIADSDPNLPFKNDVNKYISSVLTYVYRKFNQYHSGIRELVGVMNYYNKQKSNLTGFKLRTQPRNGSVVEFIIFLKMHGFIHRRTAKTSVIEFLDGKIPNTKINWIRDLHELVGFIKMLCDKSILEKKPGHPWKYLDKVFVRNSERLPENWNRNHNYLKNKEKIRRIERAINILRPRN